MTPGRPGPTSLFPPSLIPPLFSLPPFLPPPLTLSTTSLPPSTPSLTVPHLPSSLPPSPPLFLSPSLLLKFPSPLHPSLPRPSDSEFPPPSVGPALPTSLPPPLPPPPPPPPPPMRQPEIVAAAGCRLTALRPSAASEECWLTEHLLVHCKRSGPCRIRAAFGRGAARGREPRRWGGDDGGALELAEGGARCDIGYWLDDSTGGHLRTIGH